MPISRQRETVYLAKDKPATERMKGVTTRIDFHSARLGVDWHVRSLSGGRAIQKVHRALDNTESRARGS